MGSLTSLNRFVHHLSHRDAHFTTSGPTWFHGDVQNPAQLPFSVAPLVKTLIRRCRNVYLLCIDYAFRPCLSSRLTLGGLALPRKPWVYGGGVTLAALVTHASILTSGRSTAGYPTASPQTESSPTTDLKGQSAASVPCLAPCIVGACPLDQ